MDIRNEFVLDTRKLLCPLPVIRLQQTIQSRQPRDIIHVLATDRGVLYDIPAWCRIHGHTVLEITEIDQEIHFKIQIKSD